MADVEECIEVYEDSMLAAGPEATAVILRKLAAVVIIPDRDDQAMAMAAYLEDLQGYPAHILDDVAKAWRRKEKFWPTIAELRKMCQQHEHNLGRMKRELRKLYLLRAVGAEPAPDMLVTSSWVRGCEQDASLMMLGFDRSTPRKRVAGKPSIKLVSG